MNKMLVSLCVGVLQPLLTLCGEVKVLAFSGSTRTGSYNTKLIHEVTEIAHKMGAQVTVIDLKDLPMPYYNADDEAKLGMPENAKRLRASMREADVICIATPEYNGSIPAVLKNALDWASRHEQGGPAKADVFKKKFILMSASPGKGGGKRALSHLDFILKAIGATDVSSEISIPEAHLYFANDKREENLAAKTEFQRVLR
jgi:chromate reductase, NAD(P)H dehydrogenase (quinone)